MRRLRCRLLQCCNVQVARFLCDGLLLVVSTSGGLALSVGVVVVGGGGGGGVAHAVTVTAAAWVWVWVWVRVRVRGWVWVGRVLIVIIFSQFRCSGATAERLIIVPATEEFTYR